MRGAARKLLGWIGGMFVTVFVLNRGFLVWQLWAIWAFDRWTGGRAAMLIAAVVVGVFLLVFPVLYLLQSKVIVLGIATSLIWHGITPELEDHLAKHLGRVVRSSGEQLSSIQQLIQQTMQRRLASLPQLIRFLVRQVMQMIPVSERLSSAVEQIDLSSVDSQQELTQQLRGELEGVLDLPQGIALVPFWLLLIANIATMVVVYRLVHGL